jgi:uncharacterized protein YjbI with pentapeptide repeats
MIVFCVPSCGLTAILYNEAAFSQSQYDMLGRCSENGDISEWNERRQRHPNEKIFLEGARFYHSFELFNEKEIDIDLLLSGRLKGASLKGVNFQNARLMFAGMISADLSYACLSAADLRSADLRFANLVEARLWSTDLRNADLRFADLSGATLWDVNLSGANLQDANLSGVCFISGAFLWNINIGSTELLAKLWENYLKDINLWEDYFSSTDIGSAGIMRADMYRATQSRVNLSGADLKRANLSSAKLLESDLSNADLSGANLSGADLRSADLSGANLSSADLRSADLRSAKLLQANISSADFSGIGTYLIGADLSSADLCGANLSGAILWNANLRRANLRETDLNGANLCYANLSGANLMSTDLSGAVLLRANLSDVELRGNQLDHLLTAASMILAGIDDGFVDIVSADLRDLVLAYPVKVKQGANLSGTNLWGADLRRTDLTFANLSGANLMSTDLRRANLSFANLSGAMLMKVNLSDADLSNADLRAAFLMANLKSCDLTGTIIDGSTSIFGCSYDKKTNFTGSGLDNARMPPEMNTQLKNNIRRISWEHWYEKRTTGSIEKVLARGFWLVSDYGSSTTRIFSVMLFALFFFCAIYARISSRAKDELLSNVYTRSIPLGVNRFLWSGNWLWLLQIFCFACVSMVSFGLGEINANIRRKHPAIIFLVTFNLMTGYFLLACIITRIGIMFGALGP